MNKLNLFCIALFAIGGLGGLAQAQASTMPAGKTRAQVIAELVAARASGELAMLHSEIGIDRYGMGNAAPLFFAPTSAGSNSFAADDEDNSLHRMASQSAGVLSRAEVIAELKRARTSGELQALWSENGPDLFVQPLAPAHRDVLIARK